MLLRRQRRKDFCFSPRINYFLASAFSFKGKIPDSYSDPFVFFLQTTDLKGPFFTETTKPTKAKSGQRNLSAKGPPFMFYFFNVTYKTERD